MRAADYSRGDVQLFLGDGIELMREMPDSSVPMILCDPPYGHDNLGHDLLSRRHHIMKDRAASHQYGIANDKMEDARSVIDGMLTQAARVLMSDSCCCCFSAGGGPDPSFAWLADRMNRGGLTFFHCVIWDKCNPGIGWRYRRQHEMIMISHRDGGKCSWADDDVIQRNIISMSKPSNGNHPNEKPVELIARLIRLHTRPGDLVVDPFMGSGTTAVACVRLGRPFIGADCDPVHFETAARRTNNAFDDLGLLSPTPAATRQSMLIDVASESPG